MRVCGIDVGQCRVYPVVLDLGRRQLIMPQEKEPQTPDNAPDWVVSHRPTSIAIDSPPRTNSRLLASLPYRNYHGIVLQGHDTNRRVCEWRLGIGGWYSTRTCREDCQPWMRTGMDLFSAFEHQGYQLDLGAGGSLFEIHPTYGFRSLLGLRHDGLRTHCQRLLPKQRPGSPGHRQRLDLLTLLLARWHIQLPGCAAHSLDWTDAILGATLGALRNEGHTFLVAAPEAQEGAIVLADMPRPFNLPPCH